VAPRRWALCSTGAVAFVLAVMMAAQSCTHTSLRRRGIDVTIRLASCSCGQCEYVKRHSGTLLPLSSVPCSDDPTLHNRGWRVVWCGGSYAIRFDPYHYRGSGGGADSRGVAPLVYIGDRYYLVLRRDELSIRITAPVPPCTVDCICASAADVTWSWRLTPALHCMTTAVWKSPHDPWCTSSVRQTAPNIRGTSQLLYALS